MYDINSRLFEVSGASERKYVFKRKEREQRGAADAMLSPWYDKHMEKRPRSEFIPKHFYMSTFLLRMCTLYIALKLYLQCSNVVIDSISLAKYSHFLQKTEQKCLSIHCNFFSYIVFFVAYPIFVRSLILCIGFV